MTAGPVIALRTAIRARLLTDPGLAALLGGERVWDEAPRGATPPYVTFGPAAARAWPDGGSPGHQHDVALLAWSVQGGDSEALAILDAMAALLDDTDLTLQGHRLVLLRVSAQETSRPDRAGQRRATLRLEALTEPS